MQLSFIGHSISLRRLSSKLLHASNSFWVGCSTEVAPSVRLHLRGVISSTFADGFDFLKQGFDFTANPAQVSTIPLTAATITPNKSALWLVCHIKEQLIEWFDHFKSCKQQVWQVQQPRSAVRSPLHVVVQKFESFNVCITHCVSACLIICSSFMRKAEIV